MRPADENRGTLIRCVVLTSFQRPLLATQIVALFVEFLEVGVTSRLIDPVVRGRGIVPVVTRVSRMFTDATDIFVQGFDARL